MTTARTAREVAQERAAQIDADEVRGGYDWGFKAVQEALGGIEPFVHIIGGLPGGGKSSFMLAVARALGEQDDKVPYVWSGEDPIHLTADRLIAAQCGIPATRLRKPGLSDKEKARVTAAAEQVGEWFLDDRPATAYELCERVWKLRRRVSVLIVDYVQVMTIAKGARYEPDTKDHVVEVVRTFFKFCKHSGIPVMLGSQYTKEAETRGPRLLAEAKQQGKPPDYTGFQPRRSDLHGSGDLIKLAKVIVQVNAPGIWNKEDPKERHKFDVYCTKQNFGEGQGQVIHLWWDPAIGVIRG